jgi:tight adherence protein B
MLMILAALCAGAFATTGVLWATGFGGASVAAAARLSKLRETEAQLPAEAKLNLRRRGAVNFGGITVLSGNLAANWAKDLERAGLTLNAKEWLVLRLAVSTVLTLVLMIVSPIPILGILGGLPLGFLGTSFWLKRRKVSRLHKMESQLVEVLQMLSSGLRAGFGLMQALESASEQTPAPLSVELRRTMRDTAMGASVEQALTSLNERIGSPDFDIVITAILIQRSVGGNLAEILDNVQHTMRERERIRGEIRTITAQQRMTGYVLAGIPIGLLVLFYMISPDFTSLLFTDPLGRMMLGGAAVSEVLGFLVIQKIVNIEI